MYWWNLEGLKSQMATRPLSDREVVPYLIAFSALMAVASTLPGASFNSWDALGAVWSGLLAVGGTFYVYRRNGGSGGELFLQRWLVIGWVVAIRLAVVLILVLIAVFIAVSLRDEISEETTWYEFLIVAVWELVFYERLAHHVGDVGQRSAVVTGA